MTKDEQKFMIAEAKKLYKDEPSGHDFSHVKRALKYAKKICQNEGGDLDVIFVATLFHDLHRLLSNEHGEYVSPQEAEKETKELLSKLNLSQEQKEQVLFAILHHEDKDDNSIVRTKELDILCDADALDALGKRGLDRTKTYCKNHNFPLFDTAFSLDTKEYVPDINPISCVHYVYRTMIPNSKNMHTQTGKNLAKKKIKVLEKFVEKQLTRVKKK